MPLAAGAAGVAQELQEACWEGSAGCAGMVSAGERGTCTHNEDTVDCRRCTGLGRGGRCGCCSCCGRCEGAGKAGEAATVGAAGKAETHPELWCLQVL